MKLKNGMKLTHTQTIKGVRYTTVSIFNGEMDLFDKIGKMIADSFDAAELNDTAAVDKAPTQKAG